MSNILNRWINPLVRWTTMAALLASCIYIVLTIRHAAFLIGVLVFYMIEYPAVWYIGPRIRALFRWRVEPLAPFDWKTMLPELLTGEAVVAFLIIAFRQAGMPW